MAVLSLLDLYLATAVLVENAPVRIILGAVLVIAWAASVVFMVKLGRSLAYGPRDRKARTTRIDTERNERIARREKELSDLKKRIAQRDQDFRQKEQGMSRIRRSMGFLEVEQHLRDSCEAAQKAVEALPLYDLTPGNCGTSARRSDRWRRSWAWPACVPRSRGAWTSWRMN